MPAEKGEARDIEQGDLGGVGRCYRRKIGNKSGRILVIGVD